VSLAPGVRLGPYEINSAIGTGGMGEVYRAHDTKLGRDIAIKVLPDHLAADRTRLQRFEQEARLASSLNHPNIVTIHDIGLAEGIPYIAMELVEGHTLRALLASGLLPVQRAIDIAAQIADGLAKAHAAGIVHRDLKPENVMVTRDGFVKILDFGLGKLSTPFADNQSRLETIELSASARTSPGTILGTVQYMSPEQAAGRDVDFRSDQFAFGLVLYEMVARRAAFERPTAVQTMSAIIAEEPRRVADLNPRVPERVQEIIERCLAKDPDARYASTLDLAREVRGVARHERDGGRGPRVLLGLWWGWPRRSRVAAAFAAAAMAVTLAAVARPLAPVLVRWARAPAQDPIPTRKNVAVLPLRVVGGTPQSQAFADGLSAALSGMLARLTTVPSLQVAPADEVRASRLEDGAGARSELSANLVFAGTVHHVGTEVRVDCALIDTATSRQLRANTVTAPVSDPVALQDRLLKTALEMLGVEVSASERQALVPRDTRVAEAHALYLQGRGYLQYYEKPENIESAIGAFDAALKLDPAYAGALAGRGEAFWRKYEITEEPGWTDAAVASCAHAIVLNADLAAAHLCLGRAHDGTGRYQEAAVEFGRTIEIEPTNDEAYAGLGHAEEKLGRSDEAEKTYQRAIELRPQYWVNHNRLGHFYFSQGRYSDAAATFAQVVSLAPDSFRGYSNLGGTFVQLGRYDEAIEAFKTSVGIRPTAPGYSNLGTAYFNRGLFAEAARTFEQAVTLAETSYELWGNLADAYYFAPNERAKAAAAYGKAIALGRPQLDVNPRNAALLTDLANYHAMIGERKEALALLERALTIAPRDGFVQFGAAKALNQLGDTDRSLDSLENAREAGYSMTVVRDTPNFDNLWGHPRFQRLQRGQ